MNRIQQNYQKKIRKELQKTLGFTSIMEVPKLEKITVNIGCGDAIQNSKLIDASVHDLTVITGQKPVVCKAKKSIANFKLRQGAAIGCKVDLRGDKMYDFFDKLISISLPRVRDFRGLSKNSFDGRGNYTMGIKEQLIFPEIVFDDVIKIRGMDIVIVTTAKNDHEGYELLKALGVQFRK